MTIRELRDIYEGSSTKASDINRKLIFAGIAIVWIFRDTTRTIIDHVKDLTDLAANTVEVIPDVFKPILLLFCISLLLDVCQYIVRGIMWHIYYHIHRVPEDEEKNTQAAEPEWMNAFPDSFWYSKFIPTFLAYLNLAGLMSIVNIDQLPLLQLLSGWHILYVWGVLLGTLLVWYAVLEWLPLGNIQRTSRTCSCVRFVCGLIIISVCLLLLLQRI